MGSLCSTKSTAVENSKRDAAINVNTVPYIIVSSASLSNKIADENMHATVTNSAIATDGNRSSSYYRASARRRRRSSVSPNITYTNTVVFEDEEHKHRIEVELKDRTDVQYLTLRDSPELLQSTHTCLTTGSRGTSRISSLASLAESADDVSLTPELLQPENRLPSQPMIPAERPMSPTLECNESESRLTTIGDSKENLTRSDSIRINRLKSDLSNSGEISWDSLSMKQQLGMAKSISAIDLLQQFKESEVVGTRNKKDADNPESPSDEEMLRWMECQADSERADSGRADSSESFSREEDPDEETLKELVKTKLELLCIFTQLNGPTMQSRASSIANEIIVIYEKISKQHVHASKSEREIISNIEAIRSYNDIKHYVYLRR